MTEADWLTSASPSSLLKFLRLRATDRKLRLFGCACCRLFWDNLPGEWAWQAIEAAEQYADDQVTEIAMERIRQASRKAQAKLRGAEARLGWAVIQLLRPGYSCATAEAVARLAWTGRVGHFLPQRQCELIRDLFGNPFQRERLELSAAGQDNLLYQIAQEIYEEQAFERLPFLADTLENTGCRSSAILAHCRAEVGHSLGCWVLDIILQKE